MGYRCRWLPSSLRIFHGFIDCTLLLDFTRAPGQRCAQPRGSSHGHVEYVAQNCTDAGRKTLYAASASTWLPMSVKTSLCSVMYSAVTLRNPLTRVTLVARTSFPTRFHLACCLLLVERKDGTNEEGKEA